MGDVVPQVSFEEYTKLKYELTYELKNLTENVNRLTLHVEQKFDDQDEKIKAVECKAASPTLSPTLKTLLIIIIGVAFLGSLGAAIGINLLQYVNMKV